MDLGALTGIVSAAGGGAFTGLVGQLVTRAFSIWETKEKRKDQQIANAFEEKRWANEKELLAMQMQAHKQETEDELKLVETSRSYDAFVASQEAEASLGSGNSYRWVSAVRELVRPFLTIEAQILLATVLFTIGQYDENVKKGVIETITFSASATLLWWFGERAQRRS